MKAAEENEKEEKVLAELDELKRTGGWHKIRIKILKQYASEVSREVAIEFLNWILDTNEPRLIGKVKGLYEHIGITPTEALIDEFNKWKSKQEDKPGDSDGQIFSPRI